MGKLHQAKQQEFNAITALRDYPICVVQFEACLLQESCGFETSLENCVGMTGTSSLSLKYDPVTVRGDLPTSIPAKEDKARRRPVQGALRYTLGRTDDFGRLTIFT